jgi:5-methylthioadenosine/S-adenosylhomocysteine deaminase
MAAGDGRPHRKSTIPTAFEERTPTRTVARTRVASGGRTLQFAGKRLPPGARDNLSYTSAVDTCTEELRTAAILARTAAGNAHAVTAADIFTAATIGSARALGRDDLGRITPGAKADFVMVDITHPAMQPLYDPVRSMVHAAGERAVRHVFIGGQQVVRDGKALAFDYTDASARLEMAQRRPSRRCLAATGPGARHMAGSAPAGSFLGGFRTPAICTLG